MTPKEIRSELFRLQDIQYRDFQSKLIPTVHPEHFIGVRTPELRKLAKQFSRTDDIEEFLSDLPHNWFDENQLHAFIISEMKDYPTCLAEVERFLPFIDNWATCDQLSPKVFRKHKKELLDSIWPWLSSEKTYMVRFGVGMLMQHYLEDEDFDPVFHERVAEIRSDEYYINMMIAWYFATALAKQYEATLPFIEKQTLAPWTHNKAIQKAVESRRITPEQKQYLKTLKVKL